MSQQSKCHGTYLGWLRLCHIVSYHVMSWPRQRPEGTARTSRRHALALENIHFPQQPYGSDDRYSRLWLYCGHRVGLCVLKGNVRPYYHYILYESSCNYSNPIGLAPLSMLQLHCGITLSDSEQMCVCTKFAFPLT